MLAVIRTTARPGQLKFFFTERTEVLAPARPVVLKGGDVDIRSAQQLAWQNKVAKGFNTADVPLEFCLPPSPRGTLISRLGPDRGSRQSLV